MKILEEKNQYAQLQKLLGYFSTMSIKVREAVKFSILNKIFDIMPEVLIGLSVDIVVNQQNSWLGKVTSLTTFGQILFISFATLIIWILESYYEYRYLVAWRNIAQFFQHNLRMDCYKHIQSLPLSFFETKKTGDLISTINDDVNQIERFFEKGTNDIVQIAISTIAIGAGVFFISPMIALFTIVPIILIIIGSFYFQAKLEPLFSNVREKAAKTSSRITNNILGIFTIKSFNAEDYEIKKLTNDSMNYRQANEEAIKTSSMVVPVIRMGVLSGFLFSLVYGGKLTIDGEIGVASFSLIVFWSQRLLWPLTDLAESTITFQKSMAAAKRVFSLLEEKLPDHLLLQEKGKDINIYSDGFKASVIASNLSFSYNEHKKIIDDISFFIPENKVYSFVGTTGAGKTTLLKLIMGFLKPTSGHIKINEDEIFDINNQSLRNTISIVNQDVFLFPGTIFENIAYNLELNKEEIIEIAKNIKIHDMIMSLPHNYETMVEERGQNLSGGQKQIIALLRALLRKPKILILDEATSALDNETEQILQESISNIAKTCTIIMVAHRLSLVRFSDMIIVLDKGKIAESGTHDELVNLNNIYHNLWKIQIGQSLETIDDYLII